MGWPAAALHRRRRRGDERVALVANTLGAEVTGSDRADSSYLPRLRQAGSSP